MRIKSGATKQGNVQEDLFLPGKSSKQRPQKVVVGAGFEPAKT